MSKQEIIQSIDEAGRHHLAAITFWLHPEGSAHCLSQIVILPEGRITIFLADLKTCSRFVSVSDDTANVANVVWKQFSSFFPESSGANVEWFFRFGPYSSYDSLGTHEMLRVVLFMDANRNWQDDGLMGQQVMTDMEQETILQLTGVTEVEDDLAQLPALPELPPGEL